MSNYLAIATVTAALQRTLQASVQVDVDGARVTTLRPNSIGNGTPEKGVNLYLYHVALNPIWRSSAEVRIRNRKGEGAKRSHSALDLHYMISFYGSEVELEPQRLLGSVVSTLNDRQALTSTMIQDAIADANFTYLGDSNLIEQLEEIYFSPLDLSLEDLSKVWSVFFQTPYTLSIAYKATVLMIEGEKVAQKALPVRERSFGGVTPFFSQPQIEEVIAQEGKLKPILATTTLFIKGQQLAGKRTLVRIGEIEVTPSQVTDKQITLPLSEISSDTLRAGVQRLQVLHVETDSPANSSNGRNGSTLTVNSQKTRYHTIESNVLPFVLRPTITEVTFIHEEGSDDEPRTGEISLQTYLTIGKKQRVVLALNQWSTDTPQSYLFEAKRREADQRSVVIPIRDVQPGEYLLRLHVDGAESLLEVDTDPSSATFNWFTGPKLIID
ncbi:MAG: DUF4255 domain-containing protein [Cyanobacteriota bacterium]